MSSPTAAATAATASSSISDRRRLPSDGLNPRRIQTGLPGIRRTVYDGALRVNSDARDVLCATLRDVVVASSSANNNKDGDDDSNIIISVSLQAKPELRKYFPLNALPRPSMDDTPHDEFNIPLITANDDINNTKKRRTSIPITELTNQTVMSHQSRIVDATTGERAMCAVETVETVARYRCVDILDCSGLMGDEGEEENGQDGAAAASGDAEGGVVIAIRGGGNGGEEEDVIMEGGEEQHVKQDDVHVSEEAVVVTATAGSGGGFNNHPIASTAAVDDDNAATTDVAVAVGGGGGSDAVVAPVTAPAPDTVETVEAVVPVTVSAQGEVKDATREQQPSTATATTTVQEVLSTNVVVGQQGVADVPSSSAQIATTTAAAGSGSAAPAVATSSSGVTTATTTTTNLPEANTVTSAEIHPLPKNHPPLSTSIPTTTNTTITTPENAPSWYNATSISTTEKTSLPEWFNSSAPHRTPSTYLTTRNQILQIYQSQISSSSPAATNTTTTGGGGQQQQYFLTSTAIRRVVPGDAGSLLRLHSFLCDWGLMNGKDVGENAPSDLALRGGGTSSARSGGDNTGKRKFEEVKRGIFWSKERLEQLDSVVLKHVTNNVIVVTQTVSGVDGIPQQQQQQQQQPSVDWDAFANDIGEGVNAADCQRAFLDPPTMIDDVSVKIAKTSSGGGFDLSTILDGVHPDVLKATIDASLKATNDITQARKASIAGLLASTAATKAHSEEEEIARTLMDILDQRMQRLENRVAILDDVEALLEAERVALELERRDMYTTRCRHWFGDGSS